MNTAINLLAIVLAVEVGAIIGIAITRWAWLTPNTCPQCKEQTHNYIQFTGIRLANRKAVRHLQPNYACWRYIKERKVYD
jgi:hypothetical protein